MRRERAYGHECTRIHTNKETWFFVRVYSCAFVAKGGNMHTYRIAWLPGDGIGPEVSAAARLVLDSAGLPAEYLLGDIGWEFWCREGDPLPQRTLDLLGSTDCAFFGAITSKPAADAARELAPELRTRGLTYRSPIVRMRQMLDLYICLRPCRA